MKKLLIPILLLFLFSIAYAEIGVGVSPSKIVLQIEGGKTDSTNLLVFNSGDHTIDISLKAEGDIAEFVQIDPVIQTIDPEPKPHALPIKNGKNFKLTFSPPTTNIKKTYTGMISAIGGSAETSQFGGSVGVATQVEIRTTPTISKFAFINITHLLIIGIIICIVLAGYMLKKSGLEITFKKKGY